MSIYKYIRESWNKPTDEAKKLWKERLIAWRSEPVTLRIEHPTRLDRARSVGYKAKAGYIVVRQRVDRGGHTRPGRHGQGRKPKNYRSYLALNKNYQQICEERTQKYFPNLVVLNSYLAGQDGQHYWHEIILVDPQSPTIKADSNINWVCHPANRSRVFHGKTAAGKRSRGLRWKGKGVEKARPSRRAHSRHQ